MVVLFVVGVFIGGAVGGSIGFFVGFKVVGIVVVFGGGVLGFIGGKLI